MYMVLKFATSWMSATLFMNWCSEHTHLCLKEGTAEFLLPRGPIVGEPQLSRGKLGSMRSPTQQLTQLHKC
jgi:hypothetical protein